MKSGVARTQPPTPARPVPREGVIRLRPRYSECDPMGVVHHAAYVPWLEMGRTELLRSAGVSYAQLEQAGVFLVIVRLDVRYRRPVRYDQELELRTRVIGSGRVKIDHAYELRALGGDGQPLDEVLLAAGTTLACVDGEGRVRELPAWLIGERA